MPASDTSNSCSGGARKPLRHLRVQRSSRHPRLACSGQPTAAPRRMPGPRVVGSRVPSITGADTLRSNQAPFTPGGQAQPWPRLPARAAHRAAASTAPRAAARSIEADPGTPATGDSTGLAMPPARQVDLQQAALVGLPFRPDPALPPTTRPAGAAFTARSTVPQARSPLLAPTAPERVRRRPRCRPGFPRSGPAHARNAGPARSCTPCPTEPWSRPPNPVDSAA